MKIDTDFVRSSIEEDRDHYLKAATNIGLWRSEEYVFDKYFNKESPILDIGCGA